MIDRRAFLATVVVGLAGPPIARAQSARKPARVGWLSPGDAASRGKLLAEWKAALRAHGWVEGDNIVFEYRYGGERYERLRVLADELVRLKVDLLFASSAPAARAAKEATTAIPIVFSTLNDPVRAGFVASFARPGGNMTGQAGLGPELDRKRVELLKELLPSLTRAAALANPSNPMTPQRLSEMEASARTLRIELRLVTAADARQLGEALQAMARDRPEGLIVLEDPTLIALRGRITEFAAQQRIPAMYTSSGWAEAGGLVEYAVSQLEQMRRGAGYVDKILRGAKPGDLPVEQPSKFELVINLKTARGLGLTIPQSLLLRADQVIQ